MNGKEKRKHKRINLSGYIKIAPLTTTGNTNYLKGKYLNVSQGGILFQASEQIEIGSLLKIEFSLPENKVLAAKYREFLNLEGKKTIIIGKVVRVNQKDDKYELGIQFINMYEGDMANLQRFLQIVDKNYAW